MMLGMDLSTLWAIVAVLVIALLLVKIVERINAMDDERWDRVDDDDELSDELSP